MFLDCGGKTRVSREKKMFGNWTLCSYPSGNSEFSFILIGTVFTGEHTAADCSPRSTLDHTQNKYTIHNFKCHNRNMP